MSNTHDREKTGSRHSRVIILALCIGIVAMLVAGGVVASALVFHQGEQHTTSSQKTRTPSQTPAKPGPLSAAQIQALPAAVYNAVIPGLIPYGGNADTIAKAFTVKRDVAIYGDDLRTPVARIPEKDFVGAKTTVVGAGSRDDWTLVLTPARVRLPSKADNNAPAQSAGWVRTADLIAGHALPQKVIISVGAQTLTITNSSGEPVSFPVGVGTAETPTPTNSTGYIQQRYLDPRQDETVYPIQLTTLHATTQDEPYGGSDGGLIGIHYNPTNTGAVSHGCVRLTAEAITAVNQLPLGTPVTIVP